MTRTITAAARCETTFPRLQNTPACIYQAAHGPILRFVPSTLLPLTMSITLPSLGPLHILPHSFRSGNFAL